MELYMIKLHIDFRLVFQNCFIKFMSKVERKERREGKREDKTEKERGREGREGRKEDTDSQSIPEKERVTIFLFSIS